MSAMRFWGLASLVAATACGSVPPKRASTATSHPAGTVRKGTPDDVNIVKARALGREQMFPWVAWSPEAFAKAKAEGRYILIHGAAEWCHWCHVMEETTYRHPEVGKVIRDRFVAIRVDVDARPDIEERYDEWGWPATIILDADAQELAKYRGYLKPDDMVEILSKLDQAEAMNTAATSPPESPPPLSGLAWIGTYFAQRMDLYYDDEQGGWGMRQKAPIGDNATFELRRHARTQDRAALDRAIFSLGKHAELIDPVWGGIYQYSTGKTWKNAHYEKLMTYQAQNLTAFADAYRISGNKKMLRHARDIERYINSFLSNDDGAFLVSQDADVGAHDRDAKFVDGDVFYKLGNDERRALGIPRIDENVYAEENGLAIAALASLYEATRDEAIMNRLDTAAKLILASHVDDRGRVKHDAESKREIYYLADASAFGYALARLAELGKSDAYKAAAIRIAEYLVTDMHDPRNTGGDGSFWAHTPDPDAAGVFRLRRKPYFGNINAARLFSALHRITGETRYRDLALETLAGISKPNTLRDRGRMIGAFLLALDEAGALKWN